MLRTPLWPTLAEKVVLVGLISVVFAHVLNADATAVQVAIGVTGFIVDNAAVSHAFVVRGHRWHTAVDQFAAMVTINVATVLAIATVRRQLHFDLDLRNTLFLVLLISLLITLYDRYRTMQERRIDHAEHMARLSSPSADRPVGSLPAKRIS